MPSRILVVEDDPRVAASLERALRAHGYLVDVAPDGATAIHLARGVPDAMVLDINLPDVSGLDVCRFVRSEALAVPVLMLTARAAVEATRDGRPLELTRTELRLLELFMRNPGRVLSREQMLDRVWGVDARTSSNGVEVYVGYLRRKLEEGGAPRVIQTVRGIGYVLRP